MLPPQNSSISSRRSRTASPGAPRRRASRCRSRSTPARRRSWTRCRRGRRQGRTLSLSGGGYFFRSLLLVLFCAPALLLATGEGSVVLRHPPLLRMSQLKGHRPPVLSALRAQSLSGVRVFAAPMKAVARPRSANRRSSSPFSSRPERGASPPPRGSTGLDEPRQPLGSAHAIHSQQQVHQPSRPQQALAQAQRTPSGAAAAAAAWPASRAAGANLRPTTVSITAARSATFARTGRNGAEVTIPLPGVAQAGSSGHPPPPAGGARPAALSLLSPVLPLPSASGAQQQQPRRAPTDSALLPPLGLRAHASFSQRHGGAQWWDAGGAAADGVLPPAAPPGRNGGPPADGRFPGGSLSLTGREYPSPGSSDGSSASPQREPAAKKVQVRRAKSNPAELLLLREEGSFRFPGETGVEDDGGDGETAAVSAPPAQHRAGVRPQPPEGPRPPGSSSSFLRGAGGHGVGLQHGGGGGGGGGSSQPPLVPTPPPGRPTRTGAPMSRSPSSSTGSPVALQPASDVGSDSSAAGATEEAQQHAAVAGEPPAQRAPRSALSRLAGGDSASMYSFFGRAGGAPPPSSSALGGGGSARVVVVGGAVPLRPGGKFHSYHAVDSSAPTPTPHPHHPHHPPGPGAAAPAGGRAHGGGGLFSLMLRRASAAAAPEVPLASSGSAAVSAGAGGVGGDDQQSQRHSVHFKGVPL